MQFSIVKSAVAATSFTLHFKERGKGWIPKRLWTWAAAAFDWCGRLSSHDDHIDSFLSSSFKISAISVIGVILVCIKHQPLWAHRGSAHGAERDQPCLEHIDWSQNQSYPIPMNIWCFLFLHCGAVSRVLIYSDFTKALSPWLCRDRNEGIFQTTYLPRFYCHNLISQFALE